ncbi:hypothetical protein FRZ67_02925 [Panacibacter ginsenosidivorans]|uniref:DUF2971 domain-containing protein n=1 Tax=Panacibacter ginsenosidivorans TaxID=1813871 RepID=A0A5B8V552_9BACT|nr:hypothetical protein [Panacibacter ginsenosidivorans]QEC66309.1 hypothetical protein FRZ67_02925 [Panacibacter ginsenosidivorans]
MDLHKFLYLIIEQKLFFARLDNLDDPFEGITTKLLRRDAKYSQVPLKLEDFKDDLSKKKKQQLINEKKLHDYLKKDEIEKAQRRQYVNCWYANERESMAMWNIYSNPDSLALRVEFNDLKIAITKSFLDFVLENEKRVSVIGDKVTYLPLNPFDVSLPKQKFRFSAFKKDVSFQYEMEYRFLIFTVDKLDKQPSHCTIPIDFSKFQLTVITHPHLDQWKFKNLESLLSKYNSNFKIEKSATILRAKNFS